MVENALEYDLMIATMNRPVELRRCLRSVVKQAVLPKRILIIDDGDLNFEALVQEFGSFGKCFEHVRKTTPGVVASYNLGADLATSPWLLSLDDDIVLGSQFIGRLQSLAKKVEDRPVAALVGYPLQPHLQSPSSKRRLRIELERLFLLTGKTEGRFTQTGFCTDFQRGTVKPFPYRIRHIPAGLVLWRTEILKTVRYDEWFAGYAYGADKEIGLRASVSNRIYLHSGAKALHLKSKRSRTPTIPLGEMKVLNQTLIYRRHFHRGLTSLCLFWYSMLGLLLLNAVTALLSSNGSERLAELRGMLRGILSRRAWVGACR